MNVNYSSPADSQYGRGGRGGGGRGRGGGGRGRGRGFTPQSLNSVTFDYQQMASTHPSSSNSPSPYSTGSSSRPSSSYHSNRSPIQNGPQGTNFPNPRRGHPSKPRYGRSSPHSSGPQQGSGFNTLGSGNRGQSGNRYVPPHLRHLVSAQATTITISAPRGPSNPRYLIPITFVKGTGLDAAALKKLAEAQLAAKRLEFKDKQDELEVVRGTLEDPTFPNVETTLEIGGLMSAESAPEEHTFESWTSSMMETDERNDAQAKALDPPSLPVSDPSESPLGETRSPLQLTTRTESIDAPSTLVTPEPEATVHKGSTSSPPTGNAPVIEAEKDSAPLLSTPKAPETDLPLVTQPEPSKQSQSGPPLSSSLPQPPESMKTQDENPPAFVVDCEGDPSLIPSADTTSTIQRKTFYQPLHESIKPAQPASAEASASSRATHTSPYDPNVTVSHLARSIDDPVVTCPSQPVNNKVDPVTLSDHAPDPARKSKKAKKADLRRHKAERRRRHDQEERARNFGLSKAPDQGIAREGDSDLDWGSDGPPETSGSKKVAPKKSRSRKETEEMAILADYIENTVLYGDKEQQDEERERMRAFVTSVSGPGQLHKSITEIEEDQVMMEETEHLAKGGYRTDSSSDGEEDQSGSEDPDELMDDGQSIKSTSTTAMDEILNEVLEEDSLELTDSEEEELSELDTSSYEAETDLAQKVDTGKDSDSTPVEPATEAVVSESDDSSEEDGDEEEEDVTPLTMEEAIWGRDPKAARKAKRAAKKGKLVTTGDPVTDALQAQWQADRRAKAIRKAKRAEARLEEEEAKKKKKKKKKQNKKKYGNHDEDSDEYDEDDEENKRWENYHLRDAHESIRYFIERSMNQRTLQMPPMSKTTRAKIHLVANVYGLKSRSTGRGDQRAPTLERTYRTRVWGVDLRKIQRILFGRPPKKGTQARTDFQEDYKIRRWHGNNREGALVGQGADQIGENNVGFQLLSKMGWTFGQTMGSSEGPRNGLQEPLMAVVKNSKNGLGMAGGHYHHG